MIAHKYVISLTHYITVVHLCQSLSLIMRNNKDTEINTHIGYDVMLFLCCWNIFPIIVLLF